MEQQIISALKTLADDTRRKNLQRFFKTGKGEYGEGDMFWGITVPHIHSVVKKYREASFEDIEKLLQNPVHEVRLCALLLLVQKAKHDLEKAYSLYAANIKYINNWDLVDVSAGHIVGAYLEDKDKTILTQLARSQNLWERRIAIIATFYFIVKGKDEETFKIAKILLHDKHDLIHKAVGWMLREVGKRCSQKKEEEFLEKYASAMPRTMFRYAIEHFPEQKRKKYLAK